MQRLSLGVSPLYLANLTLDNLVQSVEKANGLYSIGLAIRVKEV